MRAWAESGDGGGIQIKEEVREAEVIVAVSGGAEAETGWQGWRWRLCSTYSLNQGWAVILPERPH